MYQKKEKNILQKNEPHFSQLNVVMAHRNYFRRKNLQILKLATFTKIEDHYSRCRLATFRLERIAKCLYLFCLPNTSSFTDIMKIKKFMLPFDDAMEVHFLLGINNFKYNVVFVLNGLTPPPPQYTI